MVLRRHHGYPSASQQTASRSYYAKALLSSTNLNALVFVRLRNVRFTYQRQAFLPTEKVVLFRLSNTLLCKDAVFSGIILFKTLLSCPLQRLEACFPFVTCSLRVHFVTFTSRLKCAPLFELLSMCFSTPKLFYVFVLHVFTLTGFSEPSIVQFFGLYATSNATRSSCAFGSSLVRLCSSSIRFFGTTHQMLGFGVQIDLFASFCEPWF